MSDNEASTTTQATVSGGALRGVEDGGIRRFLAIPYAEPPVGDLRFAAPVPRSPWDGERDARAFGPTAPQHPYFGAIGELLGSIEIPGDDILTVNVWTPSTSADDRLPVVIWLHGGALERGTPALDLYDGTPFARDGIVYVSVAYRVGAEGFSVLDGAPLNLGLEDAAAGVRWVHDEIAAFGGDPARITLMGESAGGALVAALLMRPDVAPLVAGAIVESGPLVASTPRSAGKVTRGLAKLLGTAPTREGFARFSPAQILDARKKQAAGSNPLAGAPSLLLAVDPVSLPESPHDGLASVDVPLLIGSNTDEYRLWFPPAALAKIGAAQLLLVRLARRISRAAERAYRAAWPSASTGEIFGQIATDLLLRRPLVDVARSRTAPTYVYEFAWQSPVRGLGATHALEIGFVFDRLESDATTRLAGTAAPQALADRMHADWVRFITTGDPGWPTFRTGGEVMRYDVESELVPLPRAEPLDLIPAAQVV